MCRRRWGAILAAPVALTLILVSCNTPGAVAEFCSSANSSLRSGNELFSDIAGSCIRGEAASTPFTSFTPVPFLNEGEGGAPKSESCDALQAQVEGLDATSKILANYFVAMNALASFGTAKLADQVGALTHTVSTKATPLNSNEAAAVQALASLLTKLISSEYQRKHLSADIQAADPSVKAVTAALKRVVKENYFRQLNNEQTKLSQRYQVFLADNPCAKQAGVVEGGDRGQSKPDHSCHLEALITLQERWQQDLNALAAKRKAASEFVSALDTIAEGHSTLATNAKRLKAKELPGLLSPYSDELQKLASSLAKI